MSKFICEHCEQSFSAKNVLTLHMKVQHPDAGKEPVKEAKPKKAPAKKQKSKSDANEVSYDQKIKESQEQFKAHAAKMKKKQKLTNVSNQQKLTKAEVSKIFYPTMPISVLWESKPQPLNKLAEAKYVATVRPMKNDWKEIVLTGKKTVITWREGPIKGNYRLAPPRLRRL